MIEEITSWQALFNKPCYMLIPALSIQHVRSIKKGETLNGHPLTVWEDDSLFNMDAAFISASQLYNYDADSLKGFPQSLKLPPDFLLMMDSGGFDIIGKPELSEVYKQERVIEIQQTIADQFSNGIIGIVLDHPPYQEVEQDGKKRLVFKEDFLVDMQKTAVNTEIALSSRKDNLMLYPVLHGAKPYHLKIWSGTTPVSKNGVRGLAVVAKPQTSYIKTAMYVGFALQNLNVPIHFLGHGGFNSLAIIIYMLRKDVKGIPYYPHLITSDSTSHDAGSKYKNYRIPGDFRDDIVIGKDEDVKLNHLPCLCPVCSNSTPEQMKESTIGGILVALHNLWWAKLRTTVLTGLIANPDKYIDHVLSQNRDFKTRANLRGLFTLMDTIVEYKRGYSKIKATWEDVDTFKEDEKEFWL